MIFEAGLAMGRHQEKTVFVQVGKVKPFSDIGGRPHAALQRFARQQERSRRAPGDAPLRSRPRRPRLAPRRHVRTDAGEEEGQALTAI